MLTLRPYQEEAKVAVYAHLRTRDDHPCVVLPTGCHAVDHPILMFDGTMCPVENVRVGDNLMGPDSRPRRVLALCRGEGELFRIVPHRGEAFVVNGDHMLSLVRTNESRNPDRNPFGGQIEDIPLEEYLKKPRWWRHVRKLYRAPIDFGVSADLPIPPYILGILLGDGCLRGGIIELTTADDELADVWDHYAESIGCSTTVRAANRCPTYRLRRGRGKFNVLMDVIEVLGLAETDSGTKFIPHPFLIASRAERFQLLAGIIDTDGSQHRSGFELTTKSRELAADLIFLARSLGLAAICRSKWAASQTGAGGWYFRILIDGNCSEVPCRLPRKRPTVRKQKKSVLRTGFSVEPIGRGSFYGFTLDGDHRYVDGHFVVHHNSGKTPVIASICEDAVTLWHGRILILAHVKELLQQAAEKLRATCPEVHFGIYSAGLKRRDISQPVIVAGIQSIYKRASELDAFDLVIIDEAHLIPPDGEGMYRQFLAEAKAVNPNLRIVGFTATPFRLKSGSICTPEGFLNHVCFEVGVRELIRDGYLCPLVTKAGVHKPNTDQFHVRAGEFIAADVEAAMDQECLVEAACSEIVAATQNRNAVLIFASGVKHGHHIARVLEERHGIECGFVTGDTLDETRDAMLARFQAGELKYLCNVNVLTTGFDAPRIDCVVLMRPTLSPGLYYQMVGRGFRLHASKTNCLVLDFGGNVLRHGPVDQLRTKGRSTPGYGQPPAKECPECHSLVAAGYALCPECGLAFPPPERQKHDSQASGAGILSGQVTTTDYPVLDVYYRVHRKRGAEDDAPRTLRIDYKVGWNLFKSEWVCLEHDGYARQKAVAWWKQRSPDSSVPDTAQQAADIGNSGGLAAPAAITVRTVAGDPYERIVAWELGPLPETLEPTFATPQELAEVPF